MKSYEKSYKGFVIWLFVFIILVFCIPLLPTQNGNLLTLAVMNLMSLSMAVLTWIIWKNEKIYWYNGIEFEKAKQATSVQRKRYALRHAKRFTFFALAGIVYSVAAYHWSFPIGFTITVMGIGIVAVALSTIKIKLE
ncbi:MAG: hypothetical protein ACI4I5_06605 [Acutalibacteraceae bacterium]